ncbi:LysR family transcriptional regulator [Brevibacillus fluminis]|uniref:LysR family transcriptional regulator n=1 Tax=Brevibacillus fluminis TaxID=511487 RepID=A0A3M8D4L4_9BACL|nr:LysR family transcriptional regulator [Brevibacillus fluminis]RNB82387.1 LysR family transcriptional regulator [Brevibacillus fluminis]
MELRHLKTFHVVAECLNLTKAADILKYSQPTISLQIQALEKEIGHTLLSRVGKRTFLTPTGKMLKKHTEKLFSDLDELEQDLKRLEKPFGTLTIAAPEFYCSYYLSQLISVYLDLHPQVQMKMLCYNSKETIKLIDSNKADIGIIAGTCNRSGIEEILIDQEDLVLVADPEVARGKTAVEIFAEKPFITYDIEGVIKDCLDEINCKPTSTIECGSEEAIKRAVVMKAGIALISDILIEKEVQDGSLVVLERFPKRLSTYLIYPKDERDFSTVSSFIDVLLDTWQTLRP